jgi:hypothetical protein
MQIVVNKYAVFSLQRASFLEACSYAWNKNTSKLNADFVARNNQINIKKGKLQVIARKNQSGTGF